LTRKAGVVFLIALCHHGKVPLGTLSSEFCAETALRWSLQILLGPDHSAFLIAPAQALVAQFVESFKDFPPNRRASVSTKFWRKWSGSLCGHAAI
jgi:hypothetical protein